MKKTQFVISGVCLLIAGIGSAAALTSFEGSLYNDLQAQQQEPIMTTTARGAEGPNRSVDVQPTAIDIYASLSKYQSAQQFNSSSSDRGAQGRIASEGDMATERNREQWKQMVGPFAASVD